jgi:predicted DsbA family dithiol-disulfide isomerase
MDKAIIASTFNAHRLSHLAAKHGLQNEAEEKLFASYFTEGRNIGDEATLVQIGVEIGLDSAEVKSMLNSKDYYKEVQNDLSEAQQLGVRGVPFFVASRKVAVSGAQDSDVFLQFLEKTWKEEFKDVKGKDGNVCEDGVCTPSK